MWSERYNSTFCVSLPRCLSDSLLTISYVFSFVFVTCAYLMKTVPEMVESQALHRYRRFSISFAAHFLLHRLSIAFAETVTSCEQSNVRVVGKLSFHIFFEIFTLRLRTA